MNADSRWNLKDKYCIITGGSKGLGLACATEFLALGAVVLLVARNEADLARVQETLQAQYGPGRVFIIPADVTSATDRARVVDHAALYGRLDVLVNNAGTNLRKPAHEVSEEDYALMVSTNQTAAFFLTAACKNMLQLSRGCVVNVSSVAGIRSSGTGVPYAMTKVRSFFLWLKVPCAPK